MEHIKHGGKLLQDIATGLKRLERENKEVKLGSLEVQFLEDFDGPPEVVLETDLTTALDYLANDTYWNENSDWSNANKAIVSII